MVSGSSELASGEFKVLDVQLIAGVADSPAFARQWAMNLSQAPDRMEQTNEPSSKLGKLLWIRFKVTLWLPSG